MSSPKPNNKTGSVLFAVLALSLGSSLNAINGSLVTTAYPIIAKAFGIPYSQVSALVMYFMAATAASQPLAGGVGDFLGRKQVFVFGIAGFTLASAFAGYANSFNQLLTCRMIQAVCSGVIMANGISLLSLVAPPEKMTTYIGVLTSVVTGSSALSFPLGGFLVEHFGWRILFWINVPIGLFSLLLAIVFLPKSPVSQSRLTSLSFIGIPFIPLALSLQCYIRAEDMTVYLVLFVILCLLLIYGVLRSPESLKQVAQLSNINYTTGCLMALFASCITFALMFVIPAWILTTLGISSGLIGIYLSGFTGAMIVTSPYFGRLIDKQGTFWSSIIAVTTILGGLLLLIYLLNHLTLALALALIGCGVSIAQLIAQRICLYAAPQESQALANGIFNSYRSVGAIIGNAVAAITVVISSRKLGALGEVSGTIAEKVPENVISNADGIFVLEAVIVLFVIPLIVAFAVELFVIKPRKIS